MNIFKIRGRERDTIEGGTEMSIGHTGEGETLLPHTQTSLQIFKLKFNLLQ